MAYFEKYYGLMPLASLAKNLGRSEVSLLVKRKKIRLPAVHTWATIYTSSTLSDALGLHRKTSWELMFYTPRVIDETQPVPYYKAPGKVMWITYGLKEAAERRLPTVILYEQNEPMLAVYKQRLRGWLADPLNHWFFMGRETRIVDRDLRGVVMQAQRAWGDAWLSTGEAARLVHVAPSTVSTWVKRGWLAGAIRYGNWRVLRSEVLAVAERRFN
jgi:hypothetical protein